MMNRKPDPEKYCVQCGDMLARKRFSSGALEDMGRFKKRLYCNTECQRRAQVKDDATAKQTMMSRARKFKTTSCAVCAETTRLHIHHIDHDFRNNDPANLMTLCVLCHNRVHAGLITLPLTSTTP